MTPDSQPQVVVQSQPPFSVEFVFKDLKNDVMTSLETVKTTLREVHGEIKTMATKEDMRLLRDDMDAGFGQVHERIGSVENRVAPLEAAAEAERVLDQSRNRRRITLAWAGGIVSTLAIVAAVVTPFLVH